MKKILLPLMLLISLTNSFAQKRKPAFVSTDIDNFWMAYHKIIAAKDSIKQYNLLNEFYLNKATPGLKSIIQARGYTTTDFINMMTRYPKFWASIKSNTINVKNQYGKIAADLNKLKKAYPDLKPATIYFTMGAFRTNGTVDGNKILIGSELSLADKNTIISELPDWRQPFYKSQNPINEIGLLCTHEYVHTQQKELVENLLSMCLYEGVAEFISCKVTGKKSASPAIEFGKTNEKKVVEKFVSDMFTMTNNYNWIWGENKNELKIRDLGYYIGYEICERHYNQSPDKQKAIKELIELDYHDDKKVENMVNNSKLFPKSLKELNLDYESQRPTVISLAPFDNGSQKVKPGSIVISITFSEAMDINYRGFDYGPLGERHIYKFKKLIGWSNNDRTITLEVEVDPNKEYQATITNNFRSKKGFELKPYLIDFKTNE